MCTAICALTGSATSGNGTLQLVFNGSATQGLVNTIRDLAPGFYTSPEFTARYGTGTTDQQFVSLLYRNVLGRDAEPGGIAFWTDSLARGTGRAEVVVAISESYEHQVIRYAAIEQNGLLFADHPFL